MIISNPYSKNLQEKYMKKRSHKLSLVGICLVILSITACNSTPVSNTAPEASTSSQPTASSQPTTSSQPTASSQPTTSSQPTASSQTTNVYPEVAVKRFTEACAKDRGAKVQALCTCAIKEIQNRYTFDEFRKIVQDARTNGQPPGEVREILQSCRSNNP
jgi:hypothetical protein